MLKLFFEYEWESQPVLVHSVTTKAFDAPQTTTIYTYDSQLALPVTVMQQSGGNSTETSYRYAHMFTYPATGAIPARDLNEKGILAPIETLTLRNGKVVSAEYTEYAHVALDNGLSVVLPSKKYRMPLVAGPIEVTNVSRATYNAGWRYDPKYELSEQYEYDLSGNLVCIRTLHGAKTAFVYLDDFKIAEVANAGADEIFHTSFEKLMSNPAVTPKTGDRALRGSYRFTLSGFPHGEYVMTYWSCPGNSVWTKNTETVTVNASAVTVTIPDRGWIDELSVLFIYPRQVTFLVLL